MRPTRLRVVFAALILVAAPGIVASVFSQADRATQADTLVAALLRAEPGTYASSGGAWAPADPAGAIPVFVQADVLPADDPASVRVPLAIGVGASGPWTLHLRVADAEGPILRFSGASGVSRQAGELLLSPGEHTMVVALAQQAGGRRWTGTTQVRRLVVPKRGGGLAAGPVVIGERAAASDQSAAVTGPERPFVFGPTVITPAALNRFHQGDRIHVGLRIHGWKGDDRARPDLTVEYVFEQQFRDRSRFFNKTKPQQLNDSTVAKGFDGRTGEMATGMAIPLAAFPPGEFELVVRVTDRRTLATASQSARFVVVP